MAICHDDSKRFEILNQGLQTLNDLGVTYGDLRAVDRDQEWIQLRNDDVDNMWRKSDCGFGVRALVGNAWGYAASPTLSVEQVIQCAREAADIAKSETPTARRNVDIGLPNPQRGEWRTPCEKDPLDDVSPAEKVATLRALTQSLRKASSVRSGEATAHSLRVRT